jgi:hypothetical protein
MESGAASCSSCGCQGFHLDSCVCGGGLTSALDCASTVTLIRVKPNVHPVICTSGAIGMPWDTRSGGIALAFNETMEPLLPCESMKWEEGCTITLRYCIWTERLSAGKAVDGLRALQEHFGGLGRLTIPW